MTLQPNISPAWPRRPTGGSAVCAGERPPGPGCGGQCAKGSERRTDSGFTDSTIKV